MARRPAPAASPAVAALPAPLSWPASMDASELAFAGITRQAELIRAGEVSSRELVELYLERTERLDPRLNSFRVVMGETALAEAERADARRSSDEELPLLGVPVAIKDSVDVRGEVTTHGTGAFDTPAAEDAEMVKRLRAAGAVVIGKTNLPELAIYAFTESKTWGVTRNPWNTERTPGGSSGGSGAAVAAGLVGAASASDGAGSIRIPAANCGLFGLKPQRGRISLAPDREHWHGMSVNGCLTRTVLDTALYLDVTAGSAPGDPDPPPPPPRPFVQLAGTRPGRLRIACSAKGPRLLAPPTTLDEANRRALEDTAELLRSLGHEVRRRDPDYGTVGNAVTPLYLGGIRHDATRVPHPNRLERRTRSFSRLGAPYSGRGVARARAATAKRARRINRIFDDHDVLVTLVSRVPPVEVGRWEGKGAFRTLLGMSSVYPYNGVWNYLGNPAASVPAGFTDGGLPLSVQLVGRPNDEGTLLSLAAQIEAERPWVEHLPPI
jgi:amidase